MHFSICRVWNSKRKPVLLEIKIRLEPVSCGRRRISPNNALQALFVPKPKRAALAVKCGGQVDHCSRVIRPNTFEALCLGERPVGMGVSESVDADVLRESA